MEVALLCVFGYDVALKNAAIDSGGAGARSGARDLATCLATRRPASAAMNRANFLAASAFSSFLPSSFFLNW